MASTGSKFFSVLVVGQAPAALMEQYSLALKVKPYVKYKYLDAEKLKSNASKVLKNIIDNPEKFMLNDYQKDYFKERLKAINGMSTFEYYSTITHGLYYDENGDALSEENPKGKWSKYNLGKNFSYPLKLVDGSESYQALAKDVDWDAMHMNSERVRLFELIWALVMDDDDPSTEEEEQLKKIWKTRKTYLSNFKDVDHFVSHNCAYWNYAYLDENGWKDVDDAGDESSWIANFYEKFIEKLKDDDLVTIYEYCRTE